MTEVIEVHVAELQQLFNAIDPAPFREKNLDPAAEEFIVSSAWPIRDEGRLFERLASMPVRIAYTADTASEASRCDWLAVPGHRSRRANSLPSSLSHNTELATATQRSQSPTSSPTVPNAC
jgi:hypothetical protein